MPTQHQSEPSFWQAASGRRRSLALLCLIISGSAQAELGTLLYSPVQRDAIVRERKGEAGLVPELAQKRLSGVVNRQGGKGTVWLNDEAMREGDSKTPTLLGVDAVVRDRRLRVGQSVDAITGETSDLVPPGSVRVGGAKDAKGGK